MRRDENLYRSDEFCAKMLVDHLPVLAANLLYNDGLSRRTEAAAKEVRLRKINGLQSKWLLLQFCHESRCEDLYGTRSG